MDSDTQSFSTYVRKGGHFDCYPVLPTLDLYLNPCTVLKDELHIRFSNPISPNKIEAFGIKDVFTIFKNKQIFKSTEDEVYSKTENRRLRH